MESLPRIYIKWPTQCITTRTTAFTGDINLDLLFIWYSLCHLFLSSCSRCVDFFDFKYTAKHIFTDLMLRVWKQCFSWTLFPLYSAYICKNFPGKLLLHYSGVSFYIPHFFLHVCISVVSFIALQFWCFDCNSVLSSHILFLHVFQPWLSGRTCFGVPCLYELALSFVPRCFRLICFLCIGHEPTIFQISITCGCWSTTFRN